MKIIYKYKKLNILYLSVYIHIYTYLIFVFSRNNPKTILKPIFLIQLHFQKLLKCANAYKIK